MQSYGCSILPLCTAGDRFSLNTGRFPREIPRSSRNEGEKAEMNEKRLGHRLNTDQTRTESVFRLCFIRGSGLCGDRALSGPLNRPELAAKRRKVRIRRAIPKFSQSIPKQFPFVPKSAHSLPKRFPNASQIVPNPLFNRFQLYTRHFPESFHDRATFFSRSGF
jgi:hypothetical protein